MGTEICAISKLEDTTPSDELAGRGTREESTTATILVKIRRIREKTEFVTTVVVVAFVVFVVFAVVVARPLCRRRRCHRHCLASGKTSFKAKVSYLLAGS